MSQNNSPFIINIISVSNDIEEKRKIVLYWVSIFETYPMELSFDEFINKAKKLKK